MVFGVPNDDERNIDTDIRTVTWNANKGYNKRNDSSRTVADWNTFVKETLVYYLDENSQPIGGEGAVVEVDETKFGKRRYTQGHFVEGKWVLGGIERGTNGRVSCAGT